jgi:transposase
MEIPQELRLLKDFVAQLATQFESLQEENGVLKAENEKLRIENEELRRRLGLKSHNSSKPPSSDGLSKKAAFARKGLESKKTGGQLGHCGNTLQMVSQPDQIQVHHVASCPCCQKPFVLSDVEGIVSKRQVFDIPAPRLEVTEHQLGFLHCCGQRWVGRYPNGVNAPVQYGSQIKSLSILLNVECRMPLEKIEQLFEDLYGCRYNESTILRANQACYTALEPVEIQIKEAVTSNEVVHFDETGMRVEGKLHWFHVASTLLFTYLFVHAKRGKEALCSAASVISQFKNRAIHDCWASYFQFPNCKHALCNAHLLRELESLKENGATWAAEMQAFLMQLFQESQKATRILPDPEGWVSQYKALCQKADDWEPLPIPSKRGKPKNSKGRNLLNRLREHQESILAFAFEPEVPFTNNQAERDIRCLKVKQKVATSFRTLDGAKNYARIQGFISTVRKHQMNVFQQIIKVLNHKTIVFTPS